MITFKKLDDGRIHCYDDGHEIAVCHSREPEFPGGWNITLPAKQCGAMTNDTVRCLQNLISTLYVIETFKN